MVNCLVQIPQNESPSPCRPSVTDRTVPGVSLRSQNPLQTVRPGLSHNFENPLVDHHFLPMTIAILLVYLGIPPCSHTQVANCGSSTAEPSNGCEDRFLKKKNVWVSNGQGVWVVAQRSGLEMGD